MILKVSNVVFLLRHCRILTHFVVVWAVGGFLHRGVLLIISNLHTHHWIHIQSHQLSGFNHCHTHLKTNHQKKMSDSVTIKKTIMLHHSVPLLDNLLVFQNWAPSWCLALTCRVRSTWATTTIIQAFVCNISVSKAAINKHEECLPLIGHIGGDRCDWGQWDSVRVLASSHEHALAVQVFSLQDSRLIWRSY